MHDTKICHGGVKVARFPGMSEVSGSIPVSGLYFLLIFVVFNLCLPCNSSLLSDSEAWCSVHGIVHFVGSAWMSGLRLRVVIVWAGQG